MIKTLAQHLSELGRKGGRSAAKTLGKAGLSARAKRAWQTRRKAKRNGKLA